MQAQLFLREPVAEKRLWTIDIPVPDTPVQKDPRTGLPLVKQIEARSFAFAADGRTLAASVRALEIASTETITSSNGKQRIVLCKGAETFRRKFLSALARQQNWNAGDALEFQSDLRMYEELLRRAAASRRPRKPYEAANHPFVDRSAFMLDSAFLETARLAASRALANLEELATRVTNSVMHST